MPWLHHYLNGGVESERFGEGKCGNLRKNIKKLRLFGL